MLQSVDCEQPKMGLTSTVCGRALLLLAVPLLSVTLESAGR